ncbi:MAG: hypothetical protein ACLUEQ_09775 [Cloacibacillus evryensis]
MVFGGHDLVAENGRLLSECEPFTAGHSSAVIDAQLLAQERKRLTTYPEEGTAGYRTITFEMETSDTDLAERLIPRRPFVPDDGAERGRRAAAILTMQAHGLKKRLEHARAKKAVIGVSGGLDSCLALLVAVRASDLMKRPGAGVLVTMPSLRHRRTKGNSGARRRFQMRRHNGSGETPLPRHRQRGRI